MLLGLDWISGLMQAGAQGTLYGQSASVANVGRLLRYSLDLRKKCDNRNGGSQLHSLRNFTLELTFEIWGNLARNVGLEVAQLNSQQYAARCPDEFRFRGRARNSGPG